MKIEVTASPKEIAALVLALQERRGRVVNQLVFDTVNNASGMQNGTVGNTTCTGNDAVDVKMSRAEN